VLIQATVPDKDVLLNKFRIHVYLGRLSDMRVGRESCEILEKAA
jgi:hypothetical protein